jgi:hypothetical protein
MQKDTSVQMWQMSRLSVSQKSHLKISELKYSFYKSEKQKSDNDKLT